MVISRHRVRNVSTNRTGYLYNRFYPGDHWVSRTVNNYDVTTTDDVLRNFPKVNPFETTRVTQLIPSLNGTKYVLGFPHIVDRQAIGLPPTSAMNAAPAHTLFKPTLLELNNYGLEIQAKTNVSTAHVSVPTFIGELKDLPSLVKDWGGDLLTKVAKGHLSWRWAIKPMINDLKKMIDFQKAVDDRIIWLRTLRETGSIKRRCSLGKSESLVTQLNYVIESQADIIKAKRTTQHLKEVWGSAQWKLDAGYALPETNRELTKLAQRLTFGITGYEALQTAWELTPWSWFADWFLGIGTSIAANNNTIPAHAKNLCVMCKRTSTVSYEITTPSSWCAVTGSWNEKRTTKTRQISTVFLPISPSFLPLITGKTWSILGSLAVLRRKRR